MIEMNKKIAAVIARSTCDEAIQSSLPTKELDGRVASLRGKPRAFPDLAMTNTRAGCK
jgi:hypothetical protein